MVLAASGEGAPARAAINELCRLYWMPLYAYARRSGCSEQDAEDATQDFLGRISGMEILRTAAPERGRLRTFLLAVFHRDLIDSTRRASRLRRGGGIPPLPLDSLQAEQWLGTQLTTMPSETVFDRAWAMTTLDSVIQRLEEEYAARGRLSLFSALRPFLDPADGGVTMADAAAATGLETNAVRQAVYRLRQRFRMLLRAGIADTLQSPSDLLIDEEMAALRAALAGG